MAQPQTHNVFVSYATANLAFAKSVKKAIENLGFAVFLADSSLAPGTQLQSIRGHLQKARLMVLLWSDEASKSEWVRDEVGAAWGANVPVIPVCLNKGLELPPSLRASSVKYLDASGLDIGAILDVQGAVIAWWQDLLAKHAAERAGLEEQRRQQQAQATNQFLGLAAFGTLLYAMSNKK